MQKYDATKLPHYPMEDAGCDLGS